ncbi:hypothetical protein EVAR_23446_1 [Eumeta japonica]|uniref:Integrase catalytic domain-containing protein n=1 Tax=Eumeta variegata TaxID=151549 RepID=A0A4C1UL39_EUMVA|nr:hypothetical protein EVAR_23446_1 [Eumeta japonica]
MKHLSVHNVSPRYAHYPQDDVTKIFLAIDERRHCEMDKKLHTLPEKQNTATHIQRFWNFPSSDRFQHVHIHIGTTTHYRARAPLLYSTIDRQTKWPEAIPTDSITVENVAHTVYQHWIARFGCLITITTDQGRQFKSQILSNLMKIMGIKKNRTTVYPPQSNGIVERWHCMLKIDFEVSPAELTYGYDLQIPGDFFNKNATHL